MKHRSNKKGRPNCYLKNNTNIIRKYYFLCAQFSSFKTTFFTTTFRNFEKKSLSFNPQGQNSVLSRQLFLLPLSEISKKMLRPPSRIRWRILCLHQFVFFFQFSKNSILFFNFSFKKIYKLFNPLKICCLNV